MSHLDQPRPNFFNFRWFFRFSTDVFSIPGSIFKFLSFLPMPFHPPCPCPIVPCQGRSETPHSNLVSEHFPKVPSDKILKVFSCRPNFYMGFAYVFEKQGLFCPPASRRGLFLAQTLILKKMNKCLFHVYIGIACVLRKLVLLPYSFYLYFYF